MPPRAPVRARRDTPAPAPGAPAPAAVAPAPRGTTAAALAALVAVLALLAWRNRNVVDDAFIYFRYAEHFANGHGLVWNVGERVDGATCFLWVLLVGIGMRLGADPVAITFVLGLACFAAALLLTYDAVTRLLGSRGFGLAAVALLGTNFAFSASASEGLGTHLLTATLVGCLALLVRLDAAPAPRPGTLAALSLTAAAAVVTRMDAALPVGWLVGAAAVRTLGARGPAPAARLAALLAPGGAVLALYVAWRWWFYGTILPNTFYVKAVGVNAVPAGLYYLYAFLLSYLLVPHVALVLAALGRAGRAVPPTVGAAAAVVAGWWAYVVAIGGDMIGYRFLVPAMPFAVVCLLWALRDVFPNPTLRAVVLGLVLVGSAHHELAFGTAIAPNAVYRPSMRILSVPDPSTRTPILWAERQVGEWLARTFERDRSVTIAVGAAGLIPYYSKLGAIDILGLNDAWVARHGRPLRFEQYIGGFYPAHVRIATLDYLVERGAHLFLGPGTLTRADYAAAVRTTGDLVTTMFLGDEGLARSTGIRKAEFPAGAEVLHLPVRDGYVLLAVYLTRHPRIDAALAAHGWTRYPIARLGD